MRFIPAILIVIAVALSGCHPTIYLKSKDKCPPCPNEPALNTLSLNPASQADLPAMFSYLDVRPLTYMIAQNQADENQPSIRNPDVNEPNAAQPPSEEKSEPTGAIQINMTASMTFEPDTVSVNLGQPVIWKNTSELVHTVTDNPSIAKSILDAQLPTGAVPFDSGDIAPGHSYTMTFAIPGTYKYFCKYHELSGMLGRITVNPVTQ